MLPVKSDRSRPGPTAPAASLASSYPLPAFSQAPASVANAQAAAPALLLQAEPGVAADAPRAEALAVAEQVAVLPLDDSVPGCWPADERSPDGSAGLRADDSVRAARRDGSLEDAPAQADSSVAWDGYSAAARWTDDHFSPLASPVAAPADLAAADYQGAGSEPADWDDSPAG